MIYKQQKKETILYSKDRIEIFVFFLKDKKKDMEISRRSSAMSSVATVKPAEIKKPIISGACSFVRLIYGGN